MQPALHSPPNAEKRVSDLTEFSQPRLKPFIYNFDSYVAAWIYLQYYGLRHQDHLGQMEWTIQHLCGTPWKGP